MKNFDSYFLILIIICYIASSVYYLIYKKTLVANLIKTVIKSMNLTNNDLIMLYKPNPIKRKNPNKIKENTINNLIINISKNSSNIFINKNECDNCENSIKKLKRKKRKKKSKTYCCKPTIKIKSNENNDNDVDNFENFSFIDQELNMLE